MRWCAKRKRETMEREGEVNREVENGDEAFDDPLQPATTHDDETLTTKPTNDLTEEKNLLLEVESSAAAGVCEAIMVTIRGHATQKLLARESDEATMAASTTSGGEWEGAEYWKDEHWRLALEELFYNDREKRKEKQDDMVFYVYEPNSSMDNNSNSKKWGRKKPIEKRSEDAALDVTVRRFGSGILRDTDLGGIRWMESVYLNILLHTTYTCTVAICSKAALERHKSGRAEPALPLYKTSRQVFASHTHISINLKPNASGKQKEFDYKNEVELAYPQVRDPPSRMEWAHFDPRVVCADPIFSLIFSRFTFRSTTLRTPSRTSSWRTRITACACCCMPGTGRRSGGRAPRQGPPRAMARRGATTWARTRRCRCSPGTSLTLTSGARPRSREGVRAFSACRRRLKPSRSSQRSS